MGLDELAKAIKENEGEIKNLGGNKQSILVSCAYTFSNRPRISFENEDVNEEEHENRRKENPFYNRLQVTIGYHIINVGKETIKDIIVPEWKKNEKDGIYYGIQKKVDLEPEKTLDLPTKYLTFLLMRPEFNLKVANGYFKKQINQKALLKKDVDAILQGMPFIYDKKYERECGADGFYYMIGQAVYDEQHIEEPIRYEVTEKYNKVFGNFNNPLAESKKNDIKIDITDDSAYLLASILNLSE